MNAKQHIKIFAAFDKDVEEDIARFGDFLCGFNVSCSNIEISIFKNEKELCQSLEHPKEKIGDELKHCDFFFIILGGKNNEYALEKLNIAIERYAKTHGNPDIHIYVNASKEGAKNVIHFFESEKYEHYVEQFEHNDTLKAKFLTWLSAKKKNFSYEVDTYNNAPVIKISGKPVMGLVDFDALLNNKDYQAAKEKLARKQADREKYKTEMLESGGEEKDDLWDYVKSLTEEINKLQEEIAATERDTLAMYRNYAEQTLGGKYDSRRKRAIECIERGELDRAKKILDPDGSINNLKKIENENNMLAARIEINKNIAEQEIAILFAEIDRLKLNVKNKNRFDEIEKCYENIEYFQRKLKLEITVLSDYASFLAEQNKHNAAIEKYMQGLGRIKNLSKEYPEVFLPKLANILNNMAVLQRAVNSYAEAEANYTEALDIKRKLAQNNPDAYLGGIALALNNLATLQLNTSRYTEAEANYVEALEIYRKLIKNNPDAYLPDLARTLSNFATLQADTNRYAEAEANYFEALCIRRKLAKNNPSAYLSYVSTTLNNLAFMQEKINRYAEAESNYLEALGIRQKLAQNNPDAHLPDVLNTLACLDRLQKDTNPNNAVAHNYRGNEYLKKMDYDQAIANFDMAIQLNHSYAEAYASRGGAYIGKGNVDMAIEDLDKAIRLNPNLAMAYDGRGSAHVIKGEYNQGIADFETALKINPNHPTAKKNIEMVQNLCRMMGKY